MEHVANIKRFGSVGSSNIEKKILLIRKRLKVVLEPEGAAQKKSNVSNKKNAPTVEELQLCLKVY